MTEESQSSRHGTLIEGHRRFASSPWVERVFGSYGYLRLFIIQAVGSTGDWLGFLAIGAAATELGGGVPETAVGFVFSVRIIPGLFLAPLAGVLVDRWDRKRVMIVCDISRALILLSLPFANSVWQLVLASFGLEVFTLLWIPAKDSLVPSIVPEERLTTVNSLQMAATYGTVPIAAGLFIGLGRLADTMADWPGVSRVSGDQIGLGFHVDALTFFFSAAMIVFLVFPARPRAERSTSRPGLNLGSTWAELRAGWEFMFINPVVRAVCAALGAGLIGGGMLIPLGPIFATDVLHKEAADGMSILQTALGVGVAVGVALLSMSSRNESHVRIFVTSVFGGGLALLLAASMTEIWAAALLIGLLGVFAGAIYVLGFTLLQVSTDEEMRGRIFAAVYTIVRLSLIIAMAVGPFVAALLNGLSEEFFHKRLDLFGWEVFIPGVRLTLWLAALIILGAGVLAWVSVRDLLSAERAHEKQERASRS